MNPNTLFRVAATMAAALSAALFLFLLIAPATFVELYGASGDAGAEFMGRRAAPIFAGLAIVFWLGRNADDSPLRRAVSLGSAIIFSGVALTGVWAFADGSAGWVILASAAAELSLGVLFALASRRA